MTCSVLRTRTTLFAASLFSMSRGTVRPIGQPRRRVAHLRRRSRQHALLAARPDQRRQLQQARGRLALQDRQPRPAAGVQSRVDAADGQGRALLDRRHRAARSSRSTPRPASCSGCTARTKGARGAAAPRQLSGRGLAYWTDGTRGAHPLRHARLPAGRARREDRHAASPAFGTNGVVDLKLDDDQDDRSRDRARSACTRRRSSRKNVVIVGAAHRVRRRPDEQDAT